MEIKFKNGYSLGYLPSSDETPYSYLYKAYKEKKQFVIVPKGFIKLLYTYDHVPALFLENNLTVAGFKKDQIVEEE